MPQVPPDILRLARTHHRQLLALDKKARSAVEKQLSLALEEVKTELARLDPDRFRAQQLRTVAFLADLTQRLTSEKLEAVLAASIREMYSLAPGHTADEINEWMAYYGYEARPLNLAAIAEAANDSIIQRVPASMSRWGPRIERRVRAEVAMMLATRGDRATATAAVQRAIDGERWAARRIVRTETLGAYNRAHNASLMKARDEEGVDDLKKSAVVTFDARTDQDSYPVHGQVRELEEMFEDGDGRRYLHPPGRPNDREKEIPWLEPEGSRLPPPSVGGSSEGTGSDPRQVYDEWRASEDVVVQEEPNSCGPACLRQLLIDRGERVEESRLRGFGLPDGRTDALALRRAAESFGLRGGKLLAGSIDLAFDDAQAALRLVSNTGPVAVLLGSHWVVMDGIRSDGMVELRDPWGTSGPGSNGGLFAAIDEERFINAWRAASFQVFTILD